jgi:ATP-dependent protease ClpP protease subunit
MSKNLHITIKADGTVGRVDIIGSISEWNQNNAMDFRERCQVLKDSGVTSCNVYMMTVGGDCFQANEIVNILNEMFGSYTAEGGAIVASAGTYIAVCATNFVMAKNGQFMIHKPMGGGYGNETEIENYLTLLRNMTSSYFDAYVAKCKKPKADFETKWNSGDFWMTAKEAKDWGFVSAIKEPVKLPEPAQAKLNMVATANITGDELINLFSKNTNQNQNDMNLSAMALACGLAADATEAQVMAKIAGLQTKANAYDQLKAQTEQKEKDEMAAKIKTELDKAEKEKRIVATVRASWKKMLEADFEGAKAALDSIQPVVALSDEIIPGVEGKTGATYNGKTYAQLQDENPSLLAELQDKQPAVYDALFAGWKKENGI